MREKNLARFPNNRTLNCPCSFLNLFPFKIAVCVFRDSMKVDELCGNCSKDLTHMITWYKRVMLRNLLCLFSQFSMLFKNFMFKFT